MYDIESILQTSRAAFLTKERNDMQTNQNDGGQAFPMGHHRDGNSADHGGMTLRDWFAGQALIGIAMLETSRTFDEDAANAYKYADAMLKARDAEWRQH